MRTCASLALAVLVGLPPVCAAQEAVLRHFTTADGLADNSVTRLFEDSRGYIWIATAEGVSRFDGHAFVTFRPSDGLPRSPITSLGETGGTLWFATRGGRAVRVNDRAAEPRFLQHDDAGSFATISVSGRRRMGALPPQLFADRSSNFAALIRRGTVSVASDLLEDRHGNLWIGTAGGGVFVRPAEAVVTYTAAHELPDEHVLRILESRDGRIYAVTRRGGVAELREDGVEAVAGSLFAPFHTMGRRIAQDEQGTWWFGTNAGVFSAPGPALSFAFARPAAEDGPALVDALERSFTDSRGWTWDALPGGGVSLCKERGCIDYSRADGIGHEVASIAEDALGRVYFGTAKGLVRFDPRTHRFAEIDSGFKAAAVTHCLRDTRGRMWIATRRGVSHILPRLLRSPSAAQVFLTGVATGAKAHALPPRGAIQPDTVTATSRTVRFDYAAPGLTNGAVRYQHRLSPGKREWSAPRTERTQTYSALAPGVYTFTVRAIADDGTPGPPASVRIRIARPLWTWWWAAAAGVLLVGAGSLRQFQRAHRRRDLSGVPLRVLGGVEEETEDGGRHRRASDVARLFER